VGSADGETADKGEIRARKARAPVTTTMRATMPIRRVFFTLDAMNTAYKRGGKTYGTEG
jgi:hypothetical protein